MKVKELIEQLSKLDQDKHIICKFTDTTDWTDCLEIPEVTEGNDIDSNGNSLYHEDEDDLWNEEDEIKDEFKVYTFDFNY